MLHHSIRDKVQGLAASTRIYPALAGVNPEDEARSAGETLLGAQRAQNPAFRPMNSREFEIRILAGMRRDSSPPLAGSDLRLRPVTATELLRAGRSGAQIIDVRSPADFAAAHLEKSINVPLASAFETWAESVLTPDEPALLIAPPGREVEAAARFEDAGIGHVAGFLKGGMQSLEDRTSLLRGEKRYTLPSLEEALLESQPVQVVEIGRSPSSGARFSVPLEDLRTAANQLPHGREIVICSETPFRASAAASYLRSRGFPKVRTLAGGLAMWGRRPGNGLADPAPEDLAFSTRSDGLPIASRPARSGPPRRGSRGSAGS
jgi:rhodanese-related sulfurtransferase